MAPFFKIHQPSFPWTFNSLKVNKYKIPTLFHTLYVFNFLYMSYVYLYHAIHYSIIWLHYLPQIIYSLFIVYYYSSLIDFIKEPCTISFLSIISTRLNSHISPSIHMIECAQIFLTKLKTIIWINGLPFAWTYIRDIYRYRLIQYIYGSNSLIQFYVEWFVIIDHRKDI